MNFIVKLVTYDGSTQFLQMRHPSDLAPRINIPFCSMPGYCNTVTGHRVFRAMSPIPEILTEVAGVVEIYTYLEKETVYETQP